jgi:hypothetical protein
MGVRGRRNEISVPLVDRNIIVFKKVTTKGGRH